MGFICTLILVNLSVSHADYWLTPEGPVPIPAAPVIKAKPAAVTPGQVPTPQVTTGAPRATVTNTDLNKPTGQKTDPPACSSRTSDFKQMLAKVMDTNVFDVVWREDQPKPLTKSGRFIVTDVGGAVRINMINGDGDSVGTAPARVCLKMERGQPSLRVGLQRSSLKFGRKFGIVDLDAEVDELLAKLGNPNELPLIVTKGHAPGKIHIADGIDQKQIDSDFSPAVAR